MTAGAKGSTLVELLKVMQFPELGQMKSGYSAILPTLRSDGNITLETANSAFLQVHQLWSGVSVAHNHAGMRQSCSGTEVVISPYTVV